MLNLETLLDSRRPILLSGPFGTAIHERVKKGDLDNSVDGNCGLAALQSKAGIDALIDISSEYQKSVSRDLTLAVMTPTFRCDHETISRYAPGQGGILFDKAVSLTLAAIAHSGRALGNTPIVASMGPPFDCYRPELTPNDPAGSYLPQTLQALQNQFVSYLLFETVPSVRGALGAVNAYTNAVNGFINGHAHTLATYSGTKKPIILFNETYHPFEQKAEKDKGYILSFCLDENGTLEGIPLDTVIERIDMEEYQGRIIPTGYGINCNSYEVTRKALDSLSPQNVKRVVQIHMNSHPEGDCRKYDHVDTSENHDQIEFARLTKYLGRRRYQIPIIGGCCGTDAKFLNHLSELVERTQSPIIRANQRYWPLSHQVPLFLSRSERYSRPGQLALPSQPLSSS